MTTQDQNFPSSESYSRPVRLTGWGWFWVFSYLGLPVVFLGLVLDFLVQALFGWCVGVWCILG